MTVAPRGVGVGVGVGVGTGAGVAARPRGPHSRSWPG
jgi:hypothetical protein